MAGREQPTGGVKEELVGEAREERISKWKGVRAQMEIEKVKIYRVH